MVPWYILKQITVKTPTKILQFISEEKEEKEKIWSKKKKWKRRYESSEMKGKWLWQNNFIWCKIRLSPSCGSLSAFIVPSLCLQCAINGSSMCHHCVCNVSSFIFVPYVIVEKKTAFLREYFIYFYSEASRTTILNKILNPFKLFPVRRLLSTWLVISN